MSVRTESLNWTVKPGTNGSMIPETLSRPDIRGSVATGLGEEGKQLSMKLQNEIEELIKIDGSYSRI